VAITDPIRPEVFDAVNRCKTAGIGLKILTGDNIVTATAIAVELGILKNTDNDDDDISVEAKDIEDMTDDELCEILPRIRVIARSTPTIKMRVVKMLQKMGEVVAVTGDGINDAPAIKNADVGIAMGLTGTEVTKEASDIILLDDSFSTIVHAVRWGRGIYENFQRFIQFQITVNISSVVVILASVFTCLKSPFTALQILWINMIMDGPPALTLGLKRAQKNLMERPPVPRSESIITRAMLRNILFDGLYISIILILQQNFNFLGAAQNQMLTAMFTLFVVFQIFNAFNSSEIEGTIFKDIGKNKIMLLVFFLTFCLQIVITQFGGKLFNTIPLGVIIWAKIIGISATIVIFSEIIKLCDGMVKKNKSVA
jgi:Ca2+-transporting ATPase